MIYLIHFLFKYCNRAGYLVYLIERAKKCLDFSATLYIIHLFTCIIYGGWPSSMTWWVVNITAFAVMALLGEYLCMRRELHEIPISRYRSSKTLHVYLINSRNHWFFCLSFLYILVKTSSLLLNVAGFSFRTFLAFSLSVLSCISLLNM